MRKSRSQNLKASVTLNYELMRPRPDPSRDGASPPLVPTETSGLAPKTRKNFEFESRRAQNFLFHQESIFAGFGVPRIRNSGKRGDLYYLFLSLAILDPPARSRTATKELRLIYNLENLS